jgi:hypothetical protein
MCHQRKCESTKRGFACDYCKRSRYCSKKCGEEHWVEHKLVCEPMRSLIGGDVPYPKSLSEFQSYAWLKDKLSNIPAVSEKEKLAFMDTLKEGMPMTDAAIAYKNFTQKRENFYKQTILEHYIEDFLRTKEIPENVIRVYVHSLRQIEENVVRLGVEFSETKQFNESLITDTDTLSKAGFDLLAASVGKPGMMKDSTEDIQKMDAEFVLDYMKDQCTKITLMYVKNDQETRDYGFEPDPRWEGTEAVIEERFASGILQKPLWWDARYDWVKDYKRTGVFVAPTYLNEFRTSRIDSEFIGGGGNNNNLWRNEEERREEERKREERQRRFSREEAARLREEEIRRRNNESIPGFSLRNMCTDQTIVNSDVRTTLAYTHSLVGLVTSKTEIGLTRFSGFTETILDNITCTFLYWTLGWFTRTARGKKSEMAAMFVGASTALLCLYGLHSWSISSYMLAAADAAKVDRVVRSAKERLDDLVGTAKSNAVIEEVVNNEIEMLSEKFQEMPIDVFAQVMLEDVAKSESPETLKTIFSLWIKRSIESVKESFHEVKDLHDMGFTYNRTVTLWQQLQNDYDRLDTASVNQVQDLLKSYQMQEKIFAAGSEQTVRAFGYLRQTLENILAKFRTINQNNLEFRTKLGEFKEVTNVDLLDVAKTARPYFEESASVAPLRKWYNKVVAYMAPGSPVFAGAGVISMTSMLQMMGEANKVVLVQDIMHNYATNRHKYPVSQSFDWTGRANLYGLMSYIETNHDSVLGFYGKLFFMYGHSFTVFDFAMNKLFGKQDIQRKETIDMLETCYGQASIQGVGGSVSKIQIEQLLQPLVWRRFTVKAFRESLGLLCNYATIIGAMLIGTNIACDSIIPLLGYSAVADNPLLTNTTPPVGVIDMLGFITPMIALSFNVVSATVRLIHAKVNGPNTGARLYRDYARYFYQTQNTTNNWAIRQVGGAWNTVLNFILPPDPSDTPSTTANAISFSRMCIFVYVLMCVFLGSPSKKLDKIVGIIDFALFKWSTYFQNTRQ